MLALLGPPCNRQIFKVVPIMGDSDSRLLKRERKLFFVGASEVAGGHGRQAIESMRVEKISQQDIDVLVQVNAKWNGRH
jgi:hypothetical protein